VVRKGVGLDESRSAALFARRGVLDNLDDPGECFFFGDL
jgi:hypothetical protein